MRFPVEMTARYVRVWMTALFASGGLALAVLAPAAQAAPKEALGVKTLVAANCVTAFEECGSETIPVGPFKYSVPKEPTIAEAKEQGYRQAAGHPAWGITDFEVVTGNAAESTPTSPGQVPNAVPLALVTHVRTDVGPGVSTNRGDGTVRDERIR